MTEQNTLFPEKWPTHAELVSRAKRWLLNTKRCSFCFTEMTTSASEIPDAIGWTYGGESHLVECKTNLADFYSDRKKLVRRYPDCGMGMYRYYLCHPNVIQEKHLPDGWGLLYARNKIIKVIVKPNMFNPEKAATRDVRLLCSALARLQSKGLLTEKNLRYGSGAAIDAT